VNAETLIALFTGTGLATVIGVVYRIFKERRGNAQKDMAGDLTLGELFREAARREVVQVQADMSEMRAQLRELRDCKDKLEEEVRELTRLAKEQGELIELMERKYRGAQDYVQILVDTWRAKFGDDDENAIPDPPDEYFPDSRKFKPRRPNG